MYQKKYISLLGASLVPGCLFINKQIDMSFTSKQMYSTFGAFHTFVNFFFIRIVMYNKQQLQNELLFAKENKAQIILKYKDSLMKPCLAFIKKYKEEFNLENFIGKRKIQQTLVHPVVLAMDEEKVIWTILSSVIVDKRMTLQAVMGMFFERIELDMPYHKGLALEPFIQAVLANKYIIFKQMDKYLYLICTRNLTTKTDNYAHILPALNYEPVNNNRGAGYQTVPFHIITGGRLKQHDEEVCLDHINRLNATSYSIDRRIWWYIKPIFDKAPKKLKKKNRKENRIEVRKRKEQFELRVEQTPARLNLLIDIGNKFHYKNYYCTRGRTYIKAYHFDFVGDKYMRSLISTSTRELATGVEKYVPKV